MCVWVCVFIYLYMETGALGDEITNFVKDFWEELCHLEWL